MKKIIDPIPADIIDKELSRDKFVRNTNYGNNEIYIITHHDSPNTLKEIGRLREISFREAGGGTGKDCDLDDYDVNNDPYKQLVVWDSINKELLGGYRFKVCKNVTLKSDGKLNIATSNLFHFSEKFISEYAPYMIELGRSFVQPKHQSTASERKSFYALDNLWDGLGALIVDNPEVKYFFGKVTMYNSYNEEARNIVLFFLKKFFPDNENLIYPFEPLLINFDDEKYKSLFNGANYEENYKILSQSVRNLGENIPPLVNSYMNLSPTMKSFGTSINKSFGGVEETGILVTISDIYEAKKDRHIRTYQK